MSNADIRFFWLGLSSSCKHRERPFGNSVEVHAAMKAMFAAPGATLPRDWPPLPFLHFQQRLFGCSAHGGVRVLQQVSQRGLRRLCGWADQAQGLRCVRSDLRRLSFNASISAGTAGCAFQLTSAQVPWPRRRALREPGLSSAAPIARIDRLLTGMYGGQGCDRLLPRSGSSSCNMPKSAGSTSRLCTKAFMSALAAPCRTYPLSCSTAWTSAGTAGGPMPARPARPCRGHPLFVLESLQQWWDGGFRRRA